MKKRILIDASTVGNLVDGLSNYIISLIKYLPKESFNEFEYTVLINPGINRPDMDVVLANKKITVLIKKIKPIGLKRDWDMFWFLRKYEKQFDLVHITSNNYPFSLKKGICTIHDITFKRYFDHPKYSFNLATTYMNMVISNCLKRANYIIAISESTKNELIKWYKLNNAGRDKIAVIYQGYEHLISNEKSVCTHEMIFKEDYIFYLGNFRIHKNIHNLLLSYKLLIDRLPAHIKFIICGNNQYLNQSDLQLIDEINSKGKRLDFTGYLPNECVKNYFEHADAFIFPSLSEGFGIPILEAFYYNKPVLCSNTTSLPEVGGDAVIYFDPYDPESIASAIFEFYSNISMTSLMIQKGKKQLEKFSWVKTSAETVQLYRKFFQAIRN